jgi:SAM-dependent methyltransferase
MRFEQIVRFNWPYYAVAASVVAASAAAVPLLPVAWMRYATVAAAAVVALWLIASLVVSWIVYDRSRLMDWDWVLQALGFAPSAWINLHAGHDPASPVLQRIFPGARGRVLDIYDAKEMTEPSIAIARKLAANAVPAETADYRHLPVPKGTIDAALLLLSAHELRSDAARSALFAELRRVLGPGGRVVVAEHLRDWANFLAFGPGFLHFPSRRTWLRCFSRHRFDVHTEFSITPFVRVFVLRRLT